jgi:hypothetical protein
MPKDRLPDRANPPRAERIPPDQAYREREYIRKIEHVMPTLKHAEIDQITSGIATFTSDKRFIADAVPPSTRALCPHSLPRGRNYPRPRAGAHDGGTGDHGQNNLGPRFV